MLYSIYDLETKRHLSTGLNSPSKKDAINDGIDYILSDGGSEAPSKIKRMSLVNKQSYLEGHNLIVEEHAERLSEDDDFEESNYSGTQRSPFGIGS